MKQIERFLTMLLFTGLFMQSWGVRQALPVVAVGVAALIIYHCARLITGLLRKRFRNNLNQTIHTLLLVLLLLGIVTQALDYRSFAPESVALFIAGVLYCLFILTQHSRFQEDLTRLLIIMGALGGQLLVVLFTVGI